MLTNFVQSPSTDAMDTGSGSGTAAVSTPNMAGPSNGATVTPQASTSGASAPVTLSDDTLISAPGFKEPIKYGEWKSRFVDKSEYTKVTQERAAREKQWSDYVTQLQKQQQPAQKPAATGADGGFGADLKTLSEKAYVSGAEAAQLVAKLVQNGITPLAQSIQQRDEVIKLLYNKLQGIDTSVTQMRSGSTQAEQKALFANAKTAAKLPDVPVVEEFLQDIYFSHEGKDLNAEFPKLVQTRWSELVKAVRDWDKSQAAAQRPGGFGRGGNTTPGSPLKKPGFESAEDIAKQWFPLLKQGANET